MRFVALRVMQEINAGTQEAPDIRKEWRDVTLGPMSDATYNSVLRNAVENGVLTREQFKEITGKAYA